MVNVEGIIENISNDLEKKEKISKPKNEIEEKVLIMPKVLTEFFQNEDPTILSKALADMI